MTISEFKEAFPKLIEKAEHIAITSHFSPDDDSIGSVLSLYTVLTDQYPKKSIRIIYTGASVERYKVFYNFEKIEWVDDVANHLEGIDTLITADASNFARFSKIPERLFQVPVRIGFDHHPSEPDVYTLLLHKREYSSNCELIYRALLDDEPFSKEVAEHILLGVLGDTGNFAYLSTVQTGVLLLAKTLIEKVGMSIGEFRSRYGGIPIRIIPLLQELVKNTGYETVPGWPPMHTAFIERTITDAGNYTDEDTSAASAIYMGQYLTRVEGYGWGLVVTPRSDGGCRMSGRSLPGSVNMRDLHQRLGIGGGHDRASGGYWKEDNPKECLAHALDFMKNNAPLIG